jgi:hypothetical protein
MMDLSNTSRRRDYGEVRHSKKRHKKGNCKNTDKKGKEVQIAKEGI